MTKHCGLEHHGKPRIECQYKKCPVRFASAEEMDKHIMFTHEKTYGKYFWYHLLSWILL